MHHALPGFDGFDGVDEHDDVDGQVVVDEIQETDFDQDDDSDGHFFGKFPRHDKPECHGDDVTHTVENTVAVIVKRDRGCTITLDYVGSVFQNLPRALNANGEEESLPGS